MYIYIYMYVCVYVGVCLCACVYVCVYVCTYVGVRGCAPGTAYFIPARAGAWLVGGSFPGSDGRLGFVAAVPPPPPRRSRAGVGIFARFVSEDGGCPDAFY